MKEFIIFNTSGNFDEREKAIRSRVFTHGFVTLAVLLLADSFLELFGIQWAQGRSGNFVLLGAAFLAVYLELIFRDAYFSGKQRPNTLKGRLIFMLLWTALWGFNAVTTLRLDAPFAARGQLTERGCQLVLPCVLTLVGVCGFAKAAVDLCKRRGRRGEDQA